MAITFRGNLHLTNVTQQMKTNAERAIRLCAEDLLSKSVELCPIDKGDLRKSGTVAVENKGLETVAQVGFGGDHTSKYALAVHEMPNTTNWTEPGTGSKFLEKPFKENSENYLKKIADVVKV